MVMAGDYCSEGRGFESQHHILDGYFSHLFDVKLFVEKTKINGEEARVAHFYKKMYITARIWILDGN